MPGEKHISLDPRLSMIAELVGACPVCADIGCDHGRLGAFLLQSGQCARVALTDISAPSLEKARALIHRTGLDARTDFCVCDGLDGLAALPDAPGTIVIAGMGGDTIAGILEDNPAVARRARLILQPNVGAPELRARLERLGLCLTEERLARDGRRIYPILCAEAGPMALDEKETEVGPFLLKNRPEYFYDYAAFRLRVSEKAREGAIRGSDAANAASLERVIEIWRDVMECR